MSTRTFDLGVDHALETSRRDLTPGSECKEIASNLCRMVQEASVASIAEIDRVMDQLQALREHIVAEGVRVNRKLIKFAQLVQDQTLAVAAKAVKEQGQSSIYIASQLLAPKQS